MPKIEKTYKCDSCYGESCILKTNHMFPYRCPHDVEFKTNWVEVK